MRILVIEDEHKIANSIKKGLEQENFTVDIAYNGEEGLDLALGENYDVLILDRLLPKKDGIEIISTLRKKENHVPILMLTAKGQVEDKVSGLNAGADDYLAKPFAFTELLARIKALGRRPISSLGSTITLSDLELNTITYEVKRQGQKVHLSGKEYALLEYLMRHPNQVLKKEQIIHQVWDYDTDVLPNSVEVYIKHLRKKIDVPFDTPLIHTVRGFGYKIGEK